MALLQEDIACIGAGMLVADGRWSLAPVVIGCGIGTAVGDFLWILAGLVLGPPALGRPPFRWFIKDHHIERSRYWIGQRAGRLIFVSRFLPGFRTPAHLALGMSRIDMRRVLPYIVLSALLYVGLLATVATALGTTAQEYLAVEQVPVPLLLFGLAIAFWLTVKLVQRLVGARAWAVFERREPRPESNTS